ncbi:RNA polymerase sigma factor FecI [Tatumella punctata]
MFIVMTDSAIPPSGLTVDTLYHTHYGWLTLWLTRKMHSVFDAEDIAQDTFVRILGSRQRDTIRDPRSFLCTVAKRVMVDLFRRQALEKNYLDMLANLPDDQLPSAECRQIQLQTLQLLDQMLDTLSDKARRAFLLSQLEGLQYRDIALRLGVSVSAVKKYIAKATEHCLIFRLEHGL